MAENLRLRAFAGKINKAKEILVPVYVFADVEGEEPQECVWIPITKQAARLIIDEAQEREIEEVCGISEEDGCLYIDGPDSEEIEEEEEEEVAEAKETIDTTGEVVE